MPTSTTVLNDAVYSVNNKNVEKDISFIENTVEFIEKTFAELTENGASTVTKKLNFLFKTGVLGYATDVTSVFVEIKFNNEAKTVAIGDAVVKIAVVGTATALLTPLIVAALPVEGALLGIAVVATGISLDKVLDVLYSAVLEKPAHYFWESLTDTFDVDLQLLDHKGSLLGGALYKQGLGHTNDSDIDLQRLAISNLLDKVADGTLKTPLQGGLQVNVVEDRSSRDVYDISTLYKIHNGEKIDQLISFFEFDAADFLQRGKNEQLIFEKNDDYWVVVKAGDTIAVPVDSRSIANPDLYPEAESEAHFAWDAITIGKQYYSGSEVNNLLVGTANNDVLSGLAGNDYLFGGEGEDKLYGGLNDDVLHGGKDNDQLFGGSGKDTLYGEAGNDSLYGGLGNDVLEGGNEGDTLYGNDGNDTLYANTVGGGEGGFVDYGFYPIGVKDTLYGGNGNDTLYGSNGADTLYGENGNDTLYGLGGSDRLDGGDGNDYLQSGDSGYNALYGGNGNDTLQGGAGYHDNLIGGNGNDLLKGGDGFDTLYGGAGKDFLYGGEGSDVLYGDGLNGDENSYSWLFNPVQLSGDDFLFGEAGNDYLSGGRGNDRLVGGLGDDSLRGGYGNDRLTGGEGSDTFVLNLFKLGLTGGGSTVFLGELLDETPIASDSYNRSNNDSITDFSSEDKISFIVDRNWGYSPEEVTFRYDVEFKNGVENRYLTFDFNQDGNPEIGVRLENYTGNDFVFTKNIIDPDYYYTSGHGNYTLTIA